MAEGEQAIPVNQQEPVETLTESAERESMTGATPEVAAENAEPAVAHESIGSSEPDEGEDQETAAPAAVIKVETAPADFRFPTTNQTRHCFTRYIEYHRCIDAKGEGATECDKFAKYYRSLCPGEWIDRWNEQRESGTFPGPL
ncbi:cytochrome c oxidase subunit 6b-3-like isoform X2 [Nymphaea colorata]|uniref:cytochrome c oxidase subunit 6b-3-like isoform X2 n=1 Tax=Nymphaea colorata TaxID=210225 RepID=UPI00129D26F7|nr:cytochrome c oxidase subunit 6b-3-like isoform X2 [Nymphaea colorata]